MRKKEAIHTALMQLKQKGISEIAVLEHLLKKLLQYEDNVHIVVKPEFRFYDGSLKKVTIYPRDEIKSLDLDILR